MSDETPITFDEIKRVQLAPGDALVFKIEDDLTDAQCGEIKKRVQDVFPDTKVLVMSGGIDLVVVGADA